MTDDDKKKGEEKDEGVTTEQFEELKRQYDDLRTRSGEYEKLLTDPKYLDFLSSGGEDGKRPSGKRVAEATGGEEDDAADFDKMSNKELVDYLTRSFVGVLRKVVTPLAAKSDLVDAQAQVAEAKRKFSDFDDYKAEMIEQARAKPNLTAEECYHLVKGRLGGKPAKPTKRTEAPTGGARTVRKPTESFEEKFLEAWKTAGFEEK